MTGSTTIAIHVSETEFLELSKFEHFDDDSGWRANIRVGAGEFFCTDRAFYFDSLTAFYSDLKTAQSKLNGSAELKFRHENEFVRFDFTTLGHLKVSGFLGETGKVGQHLQFNLEIDQTFIPPFLISIEQVLKESERRLIVDPE